MMTASQTWDAMDAAKAAHRLAVSAYLTASADNKAYAYDVACKAREAVEAATAAHVARVQG